MHLLCKIIYIYTDVLCIDTDQFDESLDRRVWSLSDQRLKWDLEIALKRRGVPPEVETLMRDLIAQQREHDENGMEGKDANMDIDDEVMNGAVQSRVVTSKELIFDEFLDQEDVPPVNPELSEFASELQEVYILSFGRLLTLTHC